MTTQREINDLEQRVYTAETRRDDASDLIAWTLRTVKQNDPTVYAQIVELLGAEFGEEVNAWITWSRDYDSARRELYDAEASFVFA